MAETKQNEGNPFQFLLDVDDDYSAAIRASSPEEPKGGFKDD